jgi:hypothetical protein
MKNVIVLVTLAILLPLFLFSCDNTSGNNSNDAGIEICANGIDDDGDGFTDGDDYDCTETGDECSNGLDDDGDGYTDGDDYDCTETGAECSNGLDDDGDGYTDGDDLDCT